MAHFYSPVAAMVTSTSVPAAWSSRKLENLVTTACLKTAQVGWSWLVRLISVMLEFGVVQTNWPKAFKICCAASLTGKPYTPVLIAGMAMDWKFSSDASWRQLKTASYSWCSSVVPPPRFVLSQACHLGPATWITFLHGRLPLEVRTASPTRNLRLFCFRMSSLSVCMTGPPKIFHKRSYNYQLEMLKIGQNLWGNCSLWSNVFFEKEVSFHQFDF